ncbi:collagen alpha-1(iv) chain [Plakobranchus ocellatus]|uniref:Collagen alpha-1(Iv) chain n=1 Tax=Plakobranchus ocellatus TaxID=259542 RepID=A0AAV4AES4_9GAST|nr:collagen alpha-1(iv) chain [Plakobranchus ocellatus]
MTWKHPSSPVTKKFIVQRNAAKVMATVFWDVKGVILLDILPQGQCINAARYCSTLDRLKEAIRRKRPGLLRRGVVLQHDNATPHSANLTQQWLQRYGWEILPHPAHCPDLAPSDFHLFGPLKRHLGGMAFETEDYLISKLRNWFDNLDVDFFRHYLNSSSLTLIKLFLSLTVALQQKGRPGFIGLLGDIGNVGFRGLSGDKGFRGLQGDEGFMGFKGFKGFMGDEGPIGFLGVDGLDGEKGFKGDIGFEGFRGVQGKPGANGFPGQIGFPGDQGEPGYAGFSGAPGSIGDFGDFGERGGKGPRGDDGAKGNIGERGLPGGVGLPGEKGLSGRPGIDGFSPFQAPPGIPGDDGFNGLPGTPGLDGVPGDIGDEGPRGPKGMKGERADGFPGPKGFIGDEGPRGLYGREGRKGDAGIPGSDASKGSKGIKGMKGEMGSPGLEGKLGAIGEKGDRGDFGNPGEPGDGGDQGMKGLPGIAGYKGNRGDFGDDGPKGQKGFRGEKGDEGLPGPNDLRRNDRAGPKGFKGDTGDFGPDGRTGDRGPKGEEGLRGLEGPIGNKGQAGFPGSDGLNGAPGGQGRTGAPGSAGIKGYQGDRGQPGVPSTGPGILFTRHSQDSMSPICPDGTTELWQGYSLLFVMGNGRSHGQDLGTAGSCLRRFSTMPFLFCNINTVCNVASRSDYSYWLSTTEEMTRMMNPVSGPQVERYISRCVVCETPSPIIAVHSQSMMVPNCPSGWSEVWVGFSFVLSTGAGAQGSGQSLLSPGSCLESFRSQPFIECHGSGTCNYYATSNSFWMATIESRDQFGVPRQQTIKSGDVSRRVSRCAVCIKENEMGPRFFKMM